MLGPSTLYVDADKGGYLHYHERLMKLLKVGDLLVYDNTLWGGTVALPDSEISDMFDK